MQVELDSNEILAAMMEMNPTTQRRVWEFYIALQKLHPDFIREIEAGVEWMESMAHYGLEVNNAG